MGRHARRRLESTEAKNRGFVDSRFLHPVLTVDDDADSIFKALRAGACGYLLKRASAREILDAIHEVRRGGAPMSSEIARKVVATFNEPEPDAPATSRLAPREQEILKLVAGGFANKKTIAPKTTTP